MRRWVRCQCVGPTIPDLYPHVTGGDARQASTAVPFDEMAKARFLIERRPAIIIAD